MEDVADPCSWPSYFVPTAPAFLSGSKEWAQAGKSYEGGAQQVSEKCLPTKKKKRLSQKEENLPPNIKKYEN